MATRNSIVHGRKFYDVLCLPLPLPPPFQERHENFYENFLSLIQFRRHVN